MNKTAPLQDGLYSLNFVSCKEGGGLDFYWAKENLWKLYNAKDKNKVSELLELIIMNLKASDDAEAVR